MTQERANEIVSKVIYARLNVLPKMKDSEDAFHKKTEKRICDIEEETADVAIMIAQLEMIFDAGRIQSVANKKIKRLAQRLHEEV